MSWLTYFLFPGSPFYFFCSTKKSLFHKINIDDDNDVGTYVLFVGHCCCSGKQTHDGIFLRQIGFDQFFSCIRISRLNSVSSTFITFFRCFSLLDFFLVVQCNHDQIGFTMPCSKAWKYDELNTKGLVSIYCGMKRSTCTISSQYRQRQYINDHYRIFFNYF